MAVKGTLAEMSLVDLIQFNCQVGVTSRLRVENGSQVAHIYFADGTVVHTTLGEREGREVFYEILGWESGQFELDRDLASPAQTITTHWSDLLLGGLHQLDEETDQEQPAEDKLSEIKFPKDFGEMFGFDRAESPFKDEPLEMLDEPAEPEIQKEQNQLQEVVNMSTKRRSDILAEHLEDLLAASADVNGAVVVGRDGLVMASNLTLGGHDATRVGAEGAALLGLSTRTLDNLKCGEFQLAILQGKDGWIVASGAGSKAMVMGLTSANVNMGMALLEMRDIAQDVAETLG